MSTWLISDTHFGHEAMIMLAGRPFVNAHEMDQTMILRWNNQVDPEDIVYHLGDVSFHNSKQTKWIVDQLNGTKILTLGNHDEGAQAMMNRGFTLAVEQIVLDIPVPSKRAAGPPRGSYPGHNTRVLLNHYPLPALPPGIDFVLHGHIHTTTPEQRAMRLDEGELVDIPPFNINCSAEVINYMPVPIDWIVKQHIHKHF